MNEKKGDMMMKYLSLVTLGAAVGFATLALTGGGASAAALQPFQPLAAQQQNDGMMQLAASKQDRRMRSDWDSRRDGRRCSKRFGDCRHYHNGYYYETPWWTLPLFIGGAIAAQNNYDGDGYDGDGYGDRHVEWCFDRYRSYNPRNNTWVSYSGRVNQCNSPYG